VKRFRRRKINIIGAALLRSQLNEALSYEPSDYDWSDEDDALDVIFQKYRQESNKKKKQKYLQKFAKGVEGNSSVRRLLFILFIYYRLVC
jgi:hypothetical protein